MWVWDLAALMLRSRKSWLRMVPMAVALLIMTVSLGVNRSINLSPEQSVTSTLGAADGLVSPGFSVLAGSSSPTVPINRWKVRQINPYLETQVSVKGLPEEVLYQESSMPGINTKGRYALVSGKWPTKPSEVVVTPSLRQGIGGKNKLVLEPGNYDLTIVGTVGATFDKSSREILAHSGTWQAWPLTQKQAKISGLSGNYLIFLPRLIQLERAARLMTIWAPILSILMHVQRGGNSSPRNLHRYLERKSSSSIWLGFSSPAWGRVWLLRPPQRRRAESSHLLLPWACRVAN